MQNCKRAKSRKCNFHKAPAHSINSGREASVGRLRPKSGPGRTTRITRRPRLSRIYTSQSWHFFHWHVAIQLIARLLLFPHLRHTPRRDLRRDALKLYFFAFTIVWRADKRINGKVSAARHNSRNRYIEFPQIFLRPKASIKHSFFALFRQQRQRNLFIVFI